LLARAARAITPARTCHKLQAGPADAAARTRSAEAPLPQHQKPAPGTLIRSWVLSGRPISLHNQPFPWREYLSVRFQTMEPRCSLAVAERCVLSRSVAPRCHQPTRAAPDPVCCGEQFPNKPQPNSHDRSAKNSGNLPITTPITDSNKVAKSRNSSTTWAGRKFMTKAPRCHAQRNARATRDFWRD
jgi:hypothetical protein